ncbi:uncharacterized protein RCC_02614 [Ramularia collo-cygni]|uniref:Fumarylacetoacetase-like C-terminal domain-containing protein n=1 Tax=Ramularia collo-cygni TaxID=112498 RepID=A0A2D3V5L7_9PEZI|nr:uncharacterized protein RCC_02614 [Ramularia collo-cygni]CZT16779.1 uncharacterized protein RCC_02614 [Ramularia collo-cygni]
MAAFRTRLWPRCGFPKNAASLNNLQRRHYALEANDFEGMLKQKSLWETFPDHIQKLAVFHARANNYQIPLISKAAAGGLDQKKAYHVAAAIRQLREMNGEIAAGRKIGFTNNALRKQYSIDASNWSYVYRNTVVDIPAEGLKEGKSVLANISHLSQLEPKIEPEIIFGLKQPIQSTMNDVEMLECVDWIAHGFEIVASIFPGWKFTAADTTAAFALHGLLLVGPPMQLAGHSQNSGALLENLPSFNVELYRNGQMEDSGTGSNVLGSPLNALRHLAELLEKDDHNQPLQAGEIITTGTLTKASSIKNGDTWSTKLRGIDLPGLNVTFRV